MSHSLEKKLLQFISVVLVIILLFFWGRGGGMQELQNTFSYIRVSQGVATTLRMETLALQATNYKPGMPAPALTPVYLVSRKQQTQESWEFSTAGIL